MRLNRVLTGAGLWLLSVVTVAGLAWFAIDSAGDSVSGSQSVTVVAAGADGTSGSLPAETGGTSTGPGSTSVGQAAVGPDGASASSAPATTTSPTAPARPAGQPVSRTYNGTMGRVTVSCTGSVASLESASPTSGWSMTVDLEGPLEVEVEFGHGSDSLVIVQGRCVAGAPMFTATTGEAGDDGGGSGSNGSGSPGAGSSSSGGDG